MSRRRILGYILGVSALAIIAIGVASQAPAVRERAHRWAESRLTQALGREIRVGRVSLRPWQGRMDLQEVQVAQGRRLADGALITVESIRLGWSWTALLRRTLVIDRVTLIQPRLTLAPAESTAFSPALLPPLLERRTMTLDGWTIAVQRVAIEDGQVRWGPEGAQGSLDGLQGSAEWREGADGRTEVGVAVRASHLRIPSGNLPREITQLSLRAEGTARHVRIGAVEGQAAGGRIAGTGQIADPFGASRIELDLVLSAPLAAMSKAAGVATDLAGHLSLEGRLQGPWTRLAFRGKGSVELAETPHARQPISFDLRWSDGRLQIDTGQTDRPESLRAQFDLETATGAYRLRLSVFEAQLGDLRGLPALAARVAGLSVPADLDGKLSADLDLIGKGSNLATLQGHGAVRVDDLRLQTGLPSGRLEARVVATHSRLTLTTFTLDVPGGTVKGEGALDLLDRRLDLPFQADIRSVAAFGRGFGVPLLGGQATLAGRLTGTQEAPRLVGRVSWKEPRIALYAADKIEGDLEWVPRTLRSPRLVVHLGQTVAILEGSIVAGGTTPLRTLDLRRDLALDLQIQVNPGRTDDLALLLPAGVPVHGAFRARGRMTGTVQALTGEAEVALTNFEAWDEKWQRGTAVLRLTPDAIEIARLSVRRGAEEVNGDIRIGRDGALTGRLSTAAIDLARLALLSGSQVAGRAGFVLDLQGTLQESRLLGKASADALAFRDVPLGAGVATFTMARKTLDLSLALHKGSQQLRLTLGPPPDRNLRLDLALSDADLVPLLRLTGLDALTSSQARGSGRLLMSGSAADFANAAGEATFSALQLRLKDDTWESRGPVELTWRGRTATIRQARLSSQDRDLDIRGVVGEEGGIDLQIKGQIPIQTLSDRMSFVRPIAGTATADLRAQGSADAPRIVGTVQIRDGKLALSGVPAPLEEVHGTIELKGDRAVIPSLQGRIAGGNIQATGAVSWHGDEWSFRTSFEEKGGRAEEILAGLRAGKGEITGTLSLGGTLSGRTRDGKEAWSNLDGQLKLVMLDGRLARQTLMVRVLSLINLGKLFDPKTLDISASGMPYQRLTGDIAIAHGVARTENLFLESRAVHATTYGQVDLVNETVEIDLAVKPLPTVDAFVSKVPVVGWLLSGKDGALIAAFYRVSGPLSDPKVTSLPLKSIDRNVFGLFRRLLQLPEAITEP